MLVNRLTSFVEGKTELSKTQVAAALGLIKKTLPDLQAITYDGTVEHGFTPECAEWLGQKTIS